MTQVSYSESFEVPADHPSLPGHFPGNPVVPGVVVLDGVAAAVCRCSGLRVVGLPQVKFLAPLLPQQPARIELDLAAPRLRFRVLRGDFLIASGEAVTA